MKSENNPSCFLSSFSSFSSFPFVFVVVRGGTRVVSWIFTHIPVVVLVDTHQRKKRNVLSWLSWYVLLFTVCQAVYTRVYLSTEFMTCIFVLFKDAIVSFIYSCNLPGTIIDRYNQQSSSPTFVRGLKDDAPNDPQSCHNQKTNGRAADPFFNTRWTFGGKI